MHQRMLGSQIDHEGISNERDAYSSGYLESYPRRGGPLDPTLGAGRDPRPGARRGVIEPVGPDIEHPALSENAWTQGPAVGRRDADRADRELRGQPSKSAGAGIDSVAAVGC